MTGVTAALCGGRSVPSATNSPASFSISGATATQTTGTCTCTAVGGVPGYTYAWTLVSGTGISATAASSNVTAFTATGLTTGETRSAVFRCTVTDSAGQVTIAVSDVTVDIQRF